MTAALPACDSCVRKEQEVPAPAADPGPQKTRRPFDRHRRDGGMGIPLAIPSGSVAPAASIE
jgi:hypothetical protein